MQSLVLNLMNYWISIWGSTNTTLIHTVLKMQNLAKIAVGGVKTPIFKELKWLAVKEKYHFEKCTSV